MLYKIGEDGEWQTYSVPFAIPFGQQVQVYAKFVSSSDYDITIVVADDFEFSSITTSYLRFNDKIKVH